MEKLTYQRIFEQQITRSLLCLFKKYEKDYKVRLMNLKKTLLSLFVQNLPMEKER